ncbi:hypothetical protein [Aridibaculum aurantiacum]|uniref:hypothetical protein n=1 Tax=Aridibaculum aurantiacum TaxID=2810307 RepID=UPI001A971F2A|nr:hypothetical protein [Aridibaculum aurantiacum]
MERLHITTIQELRQEKLRVRLRMEQRQKELSRKMYEIPAELAAAGANSLIPAFLKGKVTNAALSGGKKLINRFVVPEESGQKKLPSVSKSISLISGAKKIFSFFRK